jgi:hypothetical protein
MGYLIVSFIGESTRLLCLMGTEKLLGTVIVNEAANHDPAVFEKEEAAF